MSGFQSLVAWRYLMANPRKLGYVALPLIVLCLPLALMGRFSSLAPQWFLSALSSRGLVPEVVLPWCALVATLLIVVALILGSFRYWFTFATTVPLGGVFVGSMALVIVLSVMNGFELDLRSKILGANAHIRVTGEDGLLANWQETHATIKATKGVVASMPYVETEGVIGANRQFTAVLIRGIDPATIATVSDLARDLEDPDALRRMLPLVEDPNMPSLADDETGGDATSEEPPSSPIDAVTPIVDQAPDDMQEIEPKDFSRGEPSGAQAVAQPTSAPDPVPPLTFHVDGNGAIAPPLDGANRQNTDREARFADANTLRRSDMLPGILVGRELARTLALYTGQEVTAVSPLSDPANPDANGNPIPFNRDFRIAGIFHSGYYEYDAQQVYVTVEALQSFLDLGDHIDGFEIRIKDSDDAPIVVADLQRALGGAFRVQSFQDINKGLFSALKVEKIGMFLIVAIIVLVASFAIVGNLFMVVMEKSREISLLKTIGATDRSIVRIFITQGLIIGMLGAGSGVAAGLWVCRDIVALGLRISAEVYYMDFLPVEVDFIAVGIVLVAGVAISMAATIYPVWLAAQTKPAYGLKRV